MTSAIAAVHVRASIALTIVALSGVAPRIAGAQCGANRTTCNACHDGVKAALPSEAAWHVDHAFAGLCVDCHGGDGAADEATRAHAGLLEPLEEAATCASCHEVKASALLEQYRAARATALARDAGATAATAEGTPRAPSPHGERGPNAVALALIGVLAIAGVLLAARRDSGLRRDEETGDHRRRTA